MHTKMHCANPYSYYRFHAKADIVLNLFIHIDSNMLLLIRCNVIFLLINMQLLYFL